MKKAFGIAVLPFFIYLATLQVGVTSCTKTVFDTVSIIKNDTVVKKDTVVVKDTLIYKDTVTLTFQPCDNRTETNIATLWTGNNIQLQELPSIYWTTGGTPVQGRPILKFDLSSIPANRSILAASLSLYAVPNPLNGDQVHAHSGTDNAVLLQRITTNWDTATLTWSNQPSTTTTNQIELPQTTDPFKNYVDLNVTNMVKDMYSSGNYGFMMQLKNTNTLYNIQNFASSKHANCDLHPKLVVTYTFGN